MELTPIPKGQKGWKVRRLELLIMEAMGRATKPNTGWGIWQKIKRISATDGDTVCLRMRSLSDRGYLIVNGSDPDCGYFYELPPGMKNKNPDVSNK